MTDFHTNDDADDNNSLPAALRCETMPRVFWKRCSERGDKVALRKKLRGVQQSVTWQEYGQNAKLTGLGFSALGLKSQGVVSVLAEGCPEWLYADFGVQGIGGICNGIYTTSSPSQIAYVLQDSSTEICLVENEALLAKVLSVRDECPALKKIVVIDPIGVELQHDSMLMSFAGLLDLGRRFDELHPQSWDDSLKRGQSQDIAILVYTSGTTGHPKGAMLSQSNLLFLMETEPMVMPQGSNDEYLNFLPLCHTAGRLLSAIFPVRSGCRVSFVERLDTLAVELKELQPSLLFAPPRLWAKMYAGVETAMKSAPPHTRDAYELAMAVGYAKARYLIEKKTVPEWLDNVYRLVDEHVLQNIKQDIGLSRCTSPLTGAAPVPTDVVNWYVALGIELREAYGQTEASGLISTTPTGSYKVGTAGLPLSHTQVRIDDNGEILVRGANVFQGYFKQPEKSQETVVDGWLKTGDVGRFDDEGWLYITDRLKDIIITDGGKNISPSEIAHKLTVSPYIADAVVIGDRRKYLTCLISIEFGNVAQYARDNNVAFTDFASLTRTPEVIELIGREISTVNQQLSRVESIKHFRLFDRPPSIEDGDLTATGKLKRNMVSTKYAALIDEMYSSN